jgi:hypothetical protein
MKSDWPEKKAREGFEVRGFIKAYKRLPHGKQFSIESKGEKPDYILIDKSSGIKVGVELTSVYISDRSVPDEHIPSVEGAVLIPQDKEALATYKKRMVAAINNKIKKAKKDYCIIFPLILAIYINEYISIYLTSNDLESLVKENNNIFDNMFPFSEVVLWNLIDGDIFSIRHSDS